MRPGKLFAIAISPPGLQQQQEPRHSLAVAGGCSLAVAMGSWDLLHAPRCAGLAGRVEHWPFMCRRWAIHVADSFGPICSVCMERPLNELRFRTMSALWPPLANQLPSRPGIIVVECLFGDGRARDCFCRGCRQGWADAGWVCPVEWQREKEALRALSLLG